MMKKNFPILAVILCLVGGAVSADILRTSKAYNARVRSMGGAFTGVADDEMALLYNPAGLSQSKMDKIQDDLYGRLTLFDFNLISSLGLMGVIPDVVTTSMTFLGGSSGLQSGDSYNQMAALMLKVYELELFNIDMDYNMFVYQRRFFAFGMFFRNETVLYTEPSGGIIPGVKGYFHNDIIMPIGVGFPLGTGDNLSLGFTMKLIKRFDIGIESISDLIGLGSFFSTFQTESIAPMNALYDPQYYFVESFLGPMNISTGRFQSVYIGSGVGLDVGFLYKLNYITSFGINFQDLVNKMNWADGTDRNIPPNIRIGIGQKLPFSVPGLIRSPQLALDFDDILRPTDFTKKVHAGVELRMLNDLIIIRGGINQGAFCASLGIEGNPLRMLFMKNKFFTPERPCCFILPFNSLPNKYYEDPDLPTFDITDPAFWLNNPVFWVFSRMIMPIFTWAHPRAEFAIIGKEMGDYAGIRTAYQFAFMVSLKYYY